MKEFILCAAIHCNDDQKHTDQPKGIITGFVVTGRRHSDCYQVIKSILYTVDKSHLVEEIQLFAPRGNQGFITSTNRYVNRAEAFKIAKVNNQIYHNIYDNDKDYENHILISEDLYPD